MAGGWRSRLVGGGLKAEPGELNSSVIAWPEQQSVAHHSLIVGVDLRLQDLRLPISICVGKSPNAPDPSNAPEQLSVTPRQPEIAAFPLTASCKDWLQKLKGLGLDLS